MKYSIEFNHKKRRVEFLLTNCKYQAGAIVDEIHGKKRQIYGKKLIKLSK